MKTLIKTIILSACAIACTFAMSCKDDKENERIVAGPDPNKATEAITFYPDSGRIATRIILTGRNFGTDKTKIELYFNEKKAAIVNVLDTSIYALVPRLPGDICEVKLTVPGKETIKFAHTFRYIESINVTTVCGSDEKAPPNFIGGLLEDVRFPSGEPIYTFVNDADELFVSNENNRSSSAVYIDIPGNNAVSLWPGEKSLAALSSITQDPQTKKLYALHKTGNYLFSMDPAELWIPRLLALDVSKISNSSFLITNYGLSYTSYDGGRMITRERVNGNLVWWKPDERVAHEIVNIGLGNVGQSYLAFSPIPEEAHIVYITAEALHAVYKLDLREANPQAVLYAGAFKVAGHKDGLVSEARFRQPHQMQFDPSGEHLYIADRANHVIRQINVKTNIVTTITGQVGKAGYKDGGPDEAMFNRPQGLSVDSKGIIYIADRENGMVRKLVVE